MCSVSGDKEAYANASSINILVRSLILRVLEETREWSSGLPGASRTSGEAFRCRLHVFQGLFIQKEIYLWLFREKKPRYLQKPPFFRVFVGSTSGRSALNPWKCAHSSDTILAFFFFFIFSSSLFSSLIQTFYPITWVQITRPGCQLIFTSPKHLSEIVVKSEKWAEQLRCPCVADSSLHLSAIQDSVLFFLWAMRVIFVTWDS